MALTVVPESCLTRMDRRTFVFFTPNPAFAAYDHHELRTASPVKANDSSGLEVETAHLNPPAILDPDASPNRDIAASMVRNRMGHFWIESKQTHRSLSISHGFGALPVVVSNDHSPGGHHPEPFVKGLHVIITHQVNLIEMT